MAEDKEQTSGDNNKGSEQQESLSQEDGRNLNLPLFMETIGVRMIAEERQKQIEKYGFTGRHHVEHDDWYDNYQLQYAATTLMMHEFQEVVDTKDNLPDGWDQEWFDKLNSRTRVKRLIIAGALIAAELDRLAESGIDVSTH